MIDKASEEEPRTDLADYQFAIEGLSRFLLDYKHHFGSQFFEKEEYVPYMCRYAMSYGNTDMFSFGKCMAGKVLGIDPDDFSPQMTGSELYLFAEWALEELNAQRAPQRPEEQVPEVATAA